MWLLALRNLWRKKTRSSVTALGIALATGTLFSLLSFRSGYERGLERELAQLGAHILVVPKGCPYDAASLALHGANWPCFLKAAYLRQVSQTPGVAVASPVFMAAHFGPNATRDVVVGITGTYLDLKPEWRIEGAFPSVSGEVLLGSKKAAELGASRHASITLDAIPSVPLRVSGVLKPTAGPDDDFVFVKLDDAQAWFKQPDQLTHILVKLTKPDLLDATVEQLRGCDAGMQMNVVPLAHLFQTIRSVIHSTQYLLVSLAAVALLVAVTALTNTMLMAVLERTREIGLLRAIGASRRQIFQVFVNETLLLCSFGAGMGLLLAFAGSQWIEGWIRNQLPYSPESALIRLEPLPVALCLGVTFLVGLSASLLPAIRAARLLPVDAFQAQARY